MKLKYAALLALAGAVALVPAAAQISPVDYSYSPVSPGAWNYRAVTGGSEASFIDGTGTARMVVACGKLTRLVTLSRVIPAPASAMSIWTSSASRNLPARFDQPSGRVISQLGASDSLLDAIVFSRGRFVVSMPGSAPLVMPSGAELAHVVEDCRG